MNRPRLVVAAAAGAVFLFLGGLGAGALIAAAQPANPAPAVSGSAPAHGAAASASVAPPSCADGAAPMTHAFASGTVWSMCWKVDPQMGLVITNAAYTAPGKPAVPVLKELELSQLEVPYDSGLQMTRDITDHGFGGRNMQTLRTNECGGTRVKASIPNFGNGALGDSETREVLCSEEADTGVGLRSTYNGNPISERLHDFRLSTISEVGWYEYTTLFSFGEDGSVTPQLGAMGDLSPTDYTDNLAWGSPIGKGQSGMAVSHTHNAVWRVHWDLGGPQKVSEYNSDFSGQRGSASAILNGALAPIANETMRRVQDRRWWSVAGPQQNADGHQMSYQLQLEATDGYSPTGSGDMAGMHGAGDGDAAFGYDVAFSQFKDCEKFATENLSTGCPTADVPQFVADKEALSDVVSWVAVSFHHVPRDEDQSPMFTHWQGFTMAPRDVFAQNPLTPPNRANLNGGPNQPAG
ncbi:copper amine oxidase [Sinomonas sp. ASV322]|uniref:copper amine oxidase n=1 Tax=Sinomonas sp. ASV322 TaxID=3041920 RepID=UPI0027DC8DE1|nr:copper amine oxidase [Sinomonas sp. ASV322]MDQ4503475.1 copper amine oxidase [Sinomonas sp. ASV322]